MDGFIMNLIFDENKVVTAVTLSLYRDVSVTEASSAMKEFYDKNKNMNGLWATFIVSGSSNTCGVRVSSNVLYRDTDLEKIKDAFEEVFSVELFSLQSAEIEDLKRLMTIVRLQEQNFFRVTSDKLAVYSEEVAEMARNLRDQTRVANSDVLIAMKNILETPENLESNTTAERKQINLNNFTVKRDDDRRRTPRMSSSCSEAKVVYGQDKVHAKQMKSGFNDNCRDSTVIKEIGDSCSEIASGQTTLNSSTESMEQSLSQLDNVSRVPSETSKAPASKKSSLNLVNNDVVDNKDHALSDSLPPLTSKPTHNVLSEAQHGKGLSQPEFDCSGKNSAADDNEIVLNKRKKVPELDEVPLKRRQAMKSVETYKDEDGFLITKEVLHMVGTDEVKSRNQSQPLSSVNINEGTNPVSTKKNSHHSRTPKISAFFSKK